jgi:cold shock CspA family protein
VTGRVALVDEEAREIAIDSGDATTQVKVAEDAQILINGEKGDLDDVKQGQEVRASLDAQPEGPQATRVEVTSKAKE